MTVVEGSGPLMGASRSWDAEQAFLEWGCVAFSAEQIRSR